MSKKIKIVRIIARLNVGGPAIHTILLTAGMDKGKFETLLVSGVSAASEGDMFYLAKEKNVNPVIIPELISASNFKKDLITFWKLFKLIRKEKPDIIHTHTARAGTLGRLAGLLYKLICTLNPEPCTLKIIHTFHGHVLHSYFGKLKSLVYLWIEKILALFTDSIIVVSEKLKEELVVLGVASSNKITTILLGLELGKYVELNASIHNPGCKTVTIVGRLVPIKNHKMFFDAARIIKESLPRDKKVKFLVVGDGALRVELEGYANSLGVKEDIEFIGWEKDMAKIYLKSDIVVLTSLNEGTPVALIEAQAAARPCVATNVGGVSSVVDDQKSGFLVSSGDTEKFVEVLGNLLNNDKLSEQMGKFGRDRIRDRFSKDRLISDIEGLYVELLQT